MAGVSELEEYIGQLSGGARLESAGHFTVDLIREARQMRALASTHSNRWAFYMTQAGVAGGARLIQMSSGIRAESVTLEFDRPHPDLEKPALLTEPRPEESTFLQLLRHALRWALGSDVPIDLIVEGPKVGFTLTGRRSAIEVREIPARPTQRLALVRRRPTEPWWKRPFRRARASLALFLEARWRLAYCPVPVKFDGLSICTGVPESLPEFRAPLMLQQLHLALQDGPGLAAVHPGLVPAYHYISGDQVEPRPHAATPLPTVGWIELFPSNPMHVASGPPSSDYFTAGSWWHEGRPEHLILAGCQPALLEAFLHQRCRCHNVLYYHGRGRDRLFCQRFGLLSNPLILFNLQTDAWSILMADDEVQTDATGLTPVLNEYLQKRIERLEMGIRHTQIRLAERSRGGHV